MCSFAFSCSSHNEHGTNCGNYIGRQPCSNYSVAGAAKKPNQKISFVAKKPHIKKETQSDQGINTHKLYMENGLLYATINGTRKYIDSTGLHDVFFWVCRNNDQVRLFLRLSDIERERCEVVGVALSDSKGNWCDCYTL